jgi:peptide alpha-N-acetyltransferase
MKYYMYHALSWPELLYVAEDDDGKIVGYVMAKMEDEDLEKDEPVHGHITSISVLRSHRKLGIATKLMRSSQYAMKTVYEAEYCSLHVRRGNRAAIALYKDVLGFEVMKIDDKYYADGEDAFDMRVYLSEKRDKKAAKKEGVSAAVTEEDATAKESEALTQADTDAESKGGAQQLAEANPAADKKKKKKNKKK